MCGTTAAQDMNRMGLVSYAKSAGLVRAFRRVT